MAFKEFVKRRIGKRSTLEADVVSCSNSVLKLSISLWNDKLKKAPYLSLYFDDEIPAIGFKAGEAYGGYKIQHYKNRENATPHIRWKFFVAAVKLSWERPTLYKVKEVGGMFVVELKDGK